MEVIPSSEVSFKGLLLSVSTYSDFKKKKIN